MSLSCAFCRVVRPKPPEGYNYPAVTVINGQAVCDDHAYYVQGGEHGHILAIIKLDEEKGHPACNQELPKGARARSISARVRRGLRG